MSDAANSETGDFNPTDFDHGFNQGQQDKAKEAAALLFGLVESFEREVEFIRDKVSPRPLIKFRAHCDRLLWSIAKLKTGYEVLAGADQLNAVNAAHNKAIELAWQAVMQTGDYANAEAYAMNVRALLLPEKAQS